MVSLIGNKNPAYRNDVFEKLKNLTIEEIITKKYDFKILSKILNCDTRTIKNKLSNELINEIKKNQYKHTKRKEFICKFCGNKFNRTAETSRYYCSKECSKNKCKQIYKSSSIYMKENNPMYNLESLKKMINTNKVFLLKKSGYEKRFEKEMKDNDLLYTGDGKLYLGRRIPDFKIKDKNKVIEITAYHFNRDDSYAKNRIENAKLYKHNCLVIFLDRLAHNNYIEIKNILNNFKDGEYSGYYYNGKFTEY